MNLFSQNTEKYAPLADRMRPNTLNDFIGQEHLIYKNSFLYRAIISNNLGSCIFYGPPGTGKTTIAHIIASTVKANFRYLNAVASGVSDAKAVIQEAKNNLELYGTKTFLLLDECHRWSKAQSDSVLQAIEKGYIVFIGSTTENPYTNMTRALVSRCRVFEFKPLSTKQVKIGLERAIKDQKNGLANRNLQVTPKALDAIAWYSGGDLRNAFNALELAADTTEPNKDGQIVITPEIAAECMQQKALSIDETMYYDLLSAFCKSLRGSDPDAALYYANRLLQSGVDAKIVARRLMAHASEDVGMADSNAILLASTALQAVEKMGMPEANLVLSHAIIYVCQAPKSNSVVLAMGAAANDAKEEGNLAVPNHLKNHPSGYGDQKTGYKYPHDFGGYVQQQYLPTKLKNKRYYKPSANGREANITLKKDNK